MRVRALSNSGDYTFGQSGANFLINDAAAVAQVIGTRLLLMQGEWFLNTADGTPYSTQILGKGTKALYDAAIQARILGTQGIVNGARVNLVNQILSYSSIQKNRVLTVTCTVNTIYGPITVVTPLTVGPSSP